MHQTTIRFGSDLWETLAVAASGEGVSVAQYVRESAVERLVRAGAVDVRQAAATDRHRDAKAPRRPVRVLPAPTLAGEARPLDERREALLGRVATGRRAASRNTESSAAVWAQSRLARARSQELRAASRRLVAAREAARAGATQRGGAPAPEDADGVVPRGARARA